MKETKVYVLIDEEQPVKDCIISVFKELYQAEQARKRFLKMHPGTICCIKTEVIYETNNQIEGK